MAEGGELAVGLFHNIGLGDHGQMGLAVILGIFKGCPGDALGAGIGGHLKVNCHALKLHAAAAQNILALGILPVEHPVNVLFGDADRTAVGIQIQFPAHGHVGGLHGAAMGRGGGALENHVAGLDLLQHIGRDGLVAGDPVFDGKAFNVLDDDGTCSNFVGQQHFQHSRCLLGDDGADAVAVHHTDGHSLLCGEVSLFRVHVGNSCLLFFENLLKSLAGLIDVHHYCPPSFV